MRTECNLFDEEVLHEVDAVEVQTEIGSYECVLES